jgi:hypothetical protein
MKLLSGFQDTRSNKEDIAITPYIFGVWMVGTEIQVYGFGLCWGFYSVFIALGFNIPKGFPFFTVIKRNYKKK